MLSQLTVLNVGHRCLRHSVCVIIVAEIFVKYVSPDIFSIQILPNLILDGALPWTPLGELMTLPRLPGHLRIGYPLFIPYLPRPLQHLAVNTFGIKALYLSAPSMSKLFFRKLTLSVPYHNVMVRYCDIDFARMSFWYS